MRHWQYASKMEIVDWSFLILAARVCVCATHGATEPPVIRGLIFSRLFLLM